MKIIWSPTAQRKIDEIAEYISADNVDAALSLIEKFDHDVQRLKRNPYLGRVVAALEDETVRELVAHPNYLIIYEIKDEYIYILTIRHAKQDENRFNFKPE
jgi:addiction module RelE/StbE family toxin